MPHSEHLVALLLTDGLMPQLGHALPVAGFSAVVDCNGSVETSTIVAAEPGLPTLFWHAKRPSNQVCSKFNSPTSPHFLNQAPPRAQQLSLRVFTMVPHLAHINAASLFDVVAGATRDGVAGAVLDFGDAVAAGAMVAMLEVAADVFTGASVMP